MTIEELMSAKGYSPAEINDLKPLLSNAKFRKDLEEELSKGAKATKDLDAYDEWFTKEITPEHAKLLKERDEAVATAAAEKSRFEALQRAQMARAAGKTEKEIADAEAERTRAAEAERQRSQQVDPRYVTGETFQQAFDKTGEAIAIAQDLVADFQQLYPGQYLNMKQMRDEAKKAKMPIQAYVEGKYKFSEKRQELAAAAEQKKIDDAVRKREQELMVQFGGSNPNLATLRPSSNGFVERKKADGDKQPWERNTNELTKNRIEKAISNASKRGELVVS